MSLSERFRRADGYFTESGRYVYEPLPFWIGTPIMLFVLIGIAGWIHAAKAAWEWLG